MTSQGGTRRRVLSAWQHWKYTIRTVGFKFVELTRDHPVLFGTSAACDVVLEGESHPARSRPDSLEVEDDSRSRLRPTRNIVIVNGHKMTTSSLHQGDEINIGDCRMFLIRADEDLDQAGRKKSAAVDDRTRVASPKQVPVQNRSRHGAKAGDPAEPPLLERGDWLDALRSPRIEPGIASVEAPLQRSNAFRRPPEQVEADVQTKPRQAKVTKRLGRLLSVWGSVAPGREKILTSPLVIGLVVSLGILVGMGFWLKSIIASTIATRTFDRGVQNFDDGDYRTAMRDFDSFLAANPEDTRAGKVQVLRSLANVRQYVTAEGGTWSSALEAAREMVEQVGQLPEFRDEQINLAELIIKIGEGLADRARQGADAKALAEAETVVGLHAQVAGQSAVDVLEPDRGCPRSSPRRVPPCSRRTCGRRRSPTWTRPSRMRRLRGCTMPATPCSSSMPNSAQDKELIARMTAANELIRKAVKIDPTRRSAEQSERPDPLGPPTSLVLRTQIDSLEAPPAEDIVYALADGYAYAVNGL